MPIPSQALSILRPQKSASVALAAILFFLCVGRGIAENPWQTWNTLDSGGSFGSFGGGSSWLPHGVSHYPPPAPIRNAAIDPAMLKAGSIAEHRAQPHSTSLCWRYVKEALVAAGGVNSYPQTIFANEAGRDLVRNHGFVQLPVNRAERAPVGSVLVYGGPGAGHVELRTSSGFVSDYRCSRPSGLPFIGAFTRLDRHHKAIPTAPLVASNGSGS